mmetsp:Transcript_30183/g.43866  ORF Transcript_30183/g.43866 Transcript_30183/m.43866 type:complete len:490 (-) Transcript_30183:233-1702(-)
MNRNNNTQDKLKELERVSQSPYELALCRMEYLDDTTTNTSTPEHDAKGGLGLAKDLVDTLEKATDSWQEQQQQQHVTETTEQEQTTSSSKELLQILTILENVHAADTDCVLSEEVSRHDGFLRCLNSCQEEGKCDNDKAVQTLAGHVEATYNTDDGIDTNSALPVFTRSELQSRLPLVFELPQDKLPQEEEELKVLIHLPTDDETEQHDTGFVMWPSAVALSRWITKNPSVVLNAGAACNATNGGVGGGILELGAGCGLVGLTAATLLRQQLELTTQEEEEEKQHDGDSYEGGTLFLTDYNPTCLENLIRNIRLNDLGKKTESGRTTSPTVVVGLDFFDQLPEEEAAALQLEVFNNNQNLSSEDQYWLDMDGTQRPQVSLILASDVMAYSNDADLVANTIMTALVEGGRAILVSPSIGRFGVEDFPECCRNVGLDVEVTRLESDHDSEESNLTEEEQDTLVQELESACVGFKENYKFTMFTIDKPITSK